MADGEDEGRSGSLTDTVLLNKEGTSVEKASTPEPVGPKPLWKKKGWKLPSYIEHIANALIKSGHDESEAVEMAVGIAKKWARGGGKVTADTRAAAQKAVAEWELKKSGTGGELSDEDFIGMIMHFEAGDEGGVSLGQPDTSIMRLRQLKKDVLEWLKSETDPNDIREGRAWVEAISKMIARDQNDRATGQRGYPSYGFSEDGDPIPVWVAELFFEDGEQSEEDGLIWKPILREGKWKLSPGPGQVPARKPITVIKDGKSDPAKLIISMSELLKNFKAGAIEHVTVPVSHDNKVTDNTGFIRDLRLAKDKDGRWVLEAAHDFTEPDVKGMAQRGTIANTSAGVLFDYPRKEDGKKFNAVLEHVALTNRPWLNGMKPFGMAADAEEVTVMSFSEDGSDFSNEELEALMADEDENAGAAADGEADGTDLAEEETSEEVDLANPPFGSAAWDKKYGTKKKGAKDDEANEDESKETDEKEPDADDKKSKKMADESSKNDPDGDGDDDSKPETDTDHDHWTKDGKLTAKGKKAGYTETKNMADDESDDKSAKKEPYGNVTYADPGYQEDGQKRYPLDTEKHIRAAWAYINKAKNAAAYSAGQLSKIKTRIRQSMKKIGVQVDMSDELLTIENERALRALAFSDRKEEIVPDDIKSDTDAFVESFGLSEEEIRDALAERDKLMLGDRERRVKDQIKAWEAEKKSPAVLAVAEQLLMADPGTVAVNLSEETTDKYGTKVPARKVTLSEAVEMLVAASGEVKLDEVQVTEKDQTKGEEPKEKDETEVELSAEVLAEARRLFLYEDKTEEEALELAKAKFGDPEQQKKDTVALAEAIASAITSKEVK